MGENVGLALEDAVLFARILEVQAGDPISKVFSTYESLRKGAVDKT